MDTVKAVKTSALAIVPDEDAWPAIQALRLAHDRQVRVWPPHINIFYPFVPELEFGKASEQLAAALEALNPFKLRFRRKGHFGSTAFLVPECDTDPGLTLLHDACVRAFPNLPDPGHAFIPHLTIGQFASESECKAFLNGCPPVELEVEIKCLCLLARDTMQHPFRTVSRVRFGLGVKDAVEFGSSQPYAFRAMMRSKQKEDSQTMAPSNFYQANESCVRLVFTLEAGDFPGGADGACGAPRHSLFVVDQSSSMGRSYEQVKAAVRYMTSEATSGRHSLDFVLYNSTAKRASADDVLKSSPCSTTSFEAAFVEIKDYIMRHPSGTDLNIVFMTDGQDTTSRDLSTAKRNFSVFLKDCERQTTFHAIGFTKSHNHSFLEEICAMGSAEGMYRYAEEGKSLETRFAEMFDFADVNVKTKLCIGETEIFCDGEDSGDGQVRFDLILSRAQLSDACWREDELWPVIVGGNEVLLEATKPDLTFTIRCVDEMEIATQGDLDRAQALLAEVQVHKATKAIRKEVQEAKSQAQIRLDKYYQVFAERVRNKLTTSGGNLTAELSSLRHEATFSKARRARAMAQRATVNASTAELMEQLLQTLPPVASEELAQLEQEKLCCTLSGQTAVDVMQDSHCDFFVFSLRVYRPEDVIDAPTVLDLQQVLSGVYSNEAFRSGVEHAVRTLGPELAHGGFLGSKKNPQALGDGVGLFRGPDGQMMNACLPLFLSEAHFARVRVQIKPILGYFFTLDPLGYKGDQLIALFGILGKMLCARAGAIGSESEVSFMGSWANWLIQDFTNLCKGIRPIAMEYLAAGSYTGAVRGDVLDDFLSSPAGRTKERLPSLAVLIGWSAAVAAEPLPQFHMAFVEELWRRNFTALYKGQPREPLVQILERLLYGPDQDASNDTSGSDTRCTRNSSSKDKEFSLWARYRRADLPKKQSDDMRRRYGTTGPEVEGLLSLDTEFAPRTPLSYEDAPDFFDATVDAELDTIRRHNSFSASLYQGRPFGQGFTGSEKRLMLIQALQFVGNDTMNEAVAAGSYLDTFSSLANENCNAETVICGALHERFENLRREKVASCVAKRNALCTAQRIVATSDLDAFAGRCLVSCPTRGGEVFNCVVALLAAGSQEVPNLSQKVEAIMTGKIDGTVVISEGSSWVHCPVETARRLQDVVGDDEFAKIELMMRGTWGHVYRESDIPNRHGHCNSNPNSELVVSFSGFRLATGGA